MRFDKSYYGFIETQHQKRIIMSTIVINGTTYKIPSSIIEHNLRLDAEDFYNELRLDYTFTGYQEFERLDNKGYNYLDETICECWSLYADLHNIEDLNDDRLMIKDVGESIFAYFVDYKKEEFVMHILEKADQ